MSTGRKSRRRRSVVGDSLEQQISSVEIRIDSPTPMKRSFHDVSLPAASEPLIVIKRQPFGSTRFNAC